MEQHIASIAEVCNGCNVLIHNVYSQAGFDSLLEGELKAYLPVALTSTRELARIATEAKAGLLILYHQVFLRDPTADVGLLNEIRQSYKGAVVSAHDLDVY